MEEPMSDKETEAVAELDGQLAQRTIIIKIDDQEGSLDVDYEGVSPWELAGVAAQLACMADDEMSEEDEEEDD